eukprot:TRINITY_DN10906_c0_g1_i6.p1 TRINITY_DN10906_c0_g1~~TRINITY_DN10906_c0_g1_i6.p1  ORF type:complete len:433 (+),score=123.05 TRINITY_DN10906_c0_g1_i6:157-1455(+)
MGRITLDLLRKRAEHNNKEISTLEEISLHQESLERIELLDTACRDLQILYLQNNIISRIENVGRLKSLRYLNLALNNIVRIQGLSGCESLEKLDLTVNFIVDVSTAATLQANRNLKELYLTGNPCAGFDGYRDYVISILPQLDQLDGTAVPRSARILALQDFAATKASVIQQIEQAGELPEVDPAAISQEAWARLDQDPSLVSEVTDEMEQQFWQEETDHTPQARYEMQKKQEAFKKAEALKRDPPKPKPTRRLFKDDGTAFNINEGDWDFILNGQDAYSPALELDFPCYKHMDTSQIDLDVQPTYVRIVVKEKMFQLSLPDEVHPDKGSARRSQITGRLLVTMPKVSYRERPKPAKAAQEETETAEKLQRLELEEAQDKLRLDTIVSDAEAARSQPKTMSRLLLNGQRQRPTGPRANDPDFVDDDDVPPLV